MLFSIIHVGVYASSHVEGTIFFFPFGGNTKCYSVLSSREGWWGDGAGVFVWSVLSSGLSKKLKEKGRLKLLTPYRGNPD